MLTSSIDPKSSLTAADHPRKLAIIQDLRALAALGVVIAHARAWQIFDFDGRTTIGIWINIAQAAPDLFFMISGFILMNSTPRALAGWGGFTHFLTRRFFRIYPTYWAVGIPVLAVWLWNPSWWSPYLNKNPQDVPSYLISSIFLLPQKHMPILVVAWTIIYEVYLYLMVAFVFLLDLRGRLWAAGCWFLGILCLNLFSVAQPDPVWRVITSPLSLEFIVGIFLAAAYRLELPRLPGVVAIAAVVVAVALIAWPTMTFTDMGYFYDHHGWRVLYFGPPVALIIALSLWMEKQGSWTFQGKLSFIGDRSYSMYLLHVPIFQLVFRTVLRFCPHPSALVITLATLSSLIILVPATEFLYQTVELRYIRLGRSPRWGGTSKVSSLSNKAASS